MLSTLEQQITAECLNNGWLQIYITVIYGANYQSQRVSLWNELIKISSIISDSAWVVLGDFIIARYTGEKIGGRKLTI